MNRAIHPAEYPLLAYADYQVVPEAGREGKSDRFRVQQVFGRQIVCILGSYPTVLIAVAAIEEHKSLREVAPDPRGDFDDVELAGREDELHELDDARDSGFRS